MNRTRIDWADFSWNPVVGCKGGCSYCYAKRMNDRFKMIPDWNVPVFFPDRLDIPFPRKPSRIFVGSMSDIFFWKPEWMEKTLEKIRQHPQHTFYFLTKKPKCYLNYNFSTNCWLGVTSIGDTYKMRYHRRFQEIFISLEPLLQDPGESFINSQFSWVIIGAMTGPGSQAHQPKREWVEAIVEQCRGTGIPVFLKGNLRKVWGEKLIQETPK